MILGNPKKFGVIAGLEDELSKSGNEKSKEYCASLMVKYYTTIKRLPDNDIRLYLFKLVKNQYLENIDQSKLSIDKNSILYTGMRNLIIGIYREYRDQNT